MRFDNSVPLEPPPVPLDACQISQACDIPSLFVSWMASGNRIVSYFNPGMSCSAPVYPFQISSLWITFNNVCCVQWPFTVDLVVYRTSYSGNPCLGPGQEIYRETFSCDEATYKYPHAGPLTPTGNVCVDGPVFIGIEYRGDPFSRYPSIVLGDELHCPPIDCSSWGGYGGHWWTWPEYWGANPGAPSFWVDGQTHSSACLDPQDVPTLSHWGMIILILTFLALGTSTAVKNRMPRLARR